MAGAVAEAMFDRDIGPKHHFSEEITGTCCDLNTGTLDEAGKENKKVPRGAESGKGRRSSCRYEIVA